MDKFAELEIQVKEFGNAVVPTRRFAFRSAQEVGEVIGALAEALATRDSQHISSTNGEFLVTLYTEPKKATRKKKPHG